MLSRPPPPNKTLIKRAKHSRYVQVLAPLLHIGRFVSLPLDAAPQPRPPTGLGTPRSEPPRLLADRARRHRVLRILDLQVQTVPPDAAAVVLEAGPAVVPRDKALGDYVAHDPAPDAPARGVDSGVLEPARPVGRPVVRRLRRHVVRGDGPAAGVGPVLGRGVGGVLGAVGVGVGGVDLEDDGGEVHAWACRRQRLELVAFQVVRAGKLEVGMLAGQVLLLLLGERRRAGERQAGPGRYV